jgi:hypothetical protein
MTVRGGLADFPDFDGDEDKALLNMLDEKTAETTTVPSEGKSEEVS